MLQVGCLVVALWEKTLLGRKKLVKRGKDGWRRGWRKRGKRREQKKGRRGGGTAYEDGDGKGGKQLGKKVMKRGKSSSGR